MYERKTVTELLRGNKYPGRGIICGMTEDIRHTVSAYFIMGRSENSRNRVFREEGSTVTIYPTATRRTPSAAAAISEGV